MTEIIEIILITTYLAVSIGLTIYAYQTLSNRQDKVCKTCGNDLERYK